MGASASKTARAAGSAASRKYPTRAPGVATTNVTSQPPAAAQASGPGPTVHPQPQATESRTEAINSDFQDPDLAARLSQLGPVQPNPTYSNSSTFHQPQSPSQPQAMQFSPSTSHLISKNLSPSGANPAPSESHDPQTTQSNFQPSASNPSQSIFPNTASNPAITLLEARKRLAEEADTEFSNIGRRGAKGRTFLDVVTIRQVLTLRDQKGMADQDIERQLGLGSGVVSRLGERGVIGVTQY